MLGSIGKRLSNTRLTTMIAGLVGLGIVVSVLVVSTALFLNLSASAHATAQQRQLVNLKTAATIVENNVSGAQVTWSEDGRQVAGITVLGMPVTFSNHDLVDSIARITEEDVSIYIFDAQSQTFVAQTTTFTAEDGSRALGTVIEADSPIAVGALAGTPMFGEEIIFDQPYYTAYQPILNRQGKPLALVFVGIDGSSVSGLIYDALRLIVIVGGATLFVLGAIGWALSRRMMRPIPKLAQTMKQIAAGDYAVDVPYSGRGNEIGEMARAVEVFRENGLRVSEMTEAEAARIVADAERRREMMGELQSAFGAVVDAAVAGDFSYRVKAEFPDAELNLLADGVNNLVGTFDRGVSEIGDVLGAMAEADFTRRMEGHYDGAFARLQTDANSVADKLGGVVRQLRHTSGELKSATGEILSGANDLSERTTKQAATIEQTSAAMEQLAATVLSNAQRAREASVKASNVTRTAEEGGEVMARATDAMERITQSSSKISNIIGLIDDIAFQTNLLALNASVEAARAGEAGKGFAVVAVEVRRLAQSAAQASSEVKVLIEQSAGEVTNGTKLVSDAAGKLASMVGAIRDNTLDLEAIARDSSEQATAIDEVTVAVRVMDEMTQHNAALVEQTNAAIEQTEAQASELDRIVDVFTIEEGEPADAVVARPPVRTQAPRLRMQGNAALAADWEAF